QTADAGHGALFGALRPLLPPPGPLGALRTVGAIRAAVGSFGGFRPFRTPLCLPRFLLLLRTPLAWFRRRSAPFAPSAARAPGNAVRIARALFAQSSGEAGGDARRFGSFLFGC